MAFDRGRQLKVTLVGDSKSLEKALGRSESRLKKFGRNIQAADRASTSAKGGAIGFLTSGRGAAIASGAGVAALALKSVTDAAARAQVILGQTSVAVQDAGLSWQQNSKQIQEAATRISKASSFDDEAVLQSFSVFVRGQKDVKKSIDLAGLAADVARGRYIDLDSATQLVNKAAMGQTGALRRAGIQIDKNATSTEALTALTKAYGGAATKYADTAAGAQARLQVSFENLQESLGNGVLPVLTQTLNVMNDVTESAGILGDALSKIGVKGSDVKKAVRGAVLATPGLGLIAGEAAGINKLFGGDKKKKPSATVSLAPNDASAARRIVAPGEGRMTPTSQTINVVVDGKVLASTVVPHVQKATKRNVGQQRGRNPGVTPAG